ncbi:MAG TPA: hypothetical protein VFK02_29110 [Kofleriaceae bacterium]|nr:hypothetical protein [Kofleriaceae bacterium]
MTRAPREPTDATEDDTAPPRRPPPRALAIAIAAAAAGCLLAACFSHRWLANRHLGDFGYSLLSFQDCRTGEPSAQPACTSISNFQVVKKTQNSPFYEQRASTVFPVLGLVTFVVLLLAAAGLLCAAGLAAAGRRPDLPISPTTISLLANMIGLVSGCVFVAIRPGEAGAVGVAWSFWAFGIGSVGGFAGAQLLAKQIRPRDPDLLYDAMNPDQF